MKDEAKQKRLEAAFDNDYNSFVLNDYKKAYAATEKELRAAREAFFNDFDRPLFEEVERAFSIWVKDGRCDLELREHEFKDTEIPNHLTRQVQKQINAIMDKRF